MAFGFGVQSSAKNAARKGEIAAIVDIGSSKIACFIGCYEPEVGVRLLGVGHHVSKGIKNGAVVDMDAAELSIRCAVEKAERAAGFTISSVIVNFSSKTLSSEHLRVQAKFGGGEVADRDLQRAVARGLSEFSEPEQVILHALPLNWWVDGVGGIRDPRGMFGKRLDVDMHFVTVGVGALRNLVHCVERCHLRIKSVVASPYAAGLGALVDDELDLGATVIDMGAGITTVSVFRDRALFYVCSVPMGGQLVTSDIARGMTTNLDAAERIKSLYGSALGSPKDDMQLINCPPMGEHGASHQESRALLTKIIRCRVEDTFDYLKAHLDKAGVSEYAGRRVVLTGGGAQLNGAKELAEITFRKNIRIGKPNGILGGSEGANGTGFCTAAGLMKYAFSTRQEAINGLPDLSGRKYRQRRYAGGGLGRSIDWLKENF